MIYIADAEAHKNLIKGPSISPASAPLVVAAIPDLPQPDNLPLLYRSRLKHYSPHGAPKLLGRPAQPPYYGPLMTFSHPPSSSSLSKPLMKRNATPKPGLTPPQFTDIAPSHSSSGSIPSGLAEPPLSPYASSKMHSLSPSIFIIVSLAAYI